MYKRVEQVFLAGLGVLSLAHERIQEGIDDLVSRGKEARMELLHRVRDRVDEVLADQPPSAHPVAEVSEQNG